MLMSANRETLFVPTRLEEQDIPLKMKMKVKVKVKWKETFCNVRCQVSASRSAS